MHKFTNYFIGIIILLVLSTINVFALEGNIEITTTANPKTGEAIEIPNINTPIEIEKMEWLDNSNNILTSSDVFKSEQEYKLKIYYVTNDKITEETKFILDGKEAEHNFTESYIIGKYIPKTDVSYLTISNINEYTYSGSAVTPKPDIYNGNNKLIENTHYKLEYRNNINAGTGKIVLKGLGNYIGEKIIDFKINPASITSVNDIASIKYTGNSIKPEPVVYFNNKVLKKNTDYRVEYSNNINPGTATVKVTGINNYCGTLNKNFTILALTKKDLPKLTLTSISGGNETFTIKWNSLSTKNKNFIDKIEVQYSRNKNFKNSKVILIPKSNISKKIKKPTKNKAYYTRVRTVKYINNKKYVSEWSNVKKSNKYGKTYILIDLSDQTLKYYKKGERKLNTNVVTGKKGNSTPTGTYKILGKGKNVRLKGPTWDRKVTYWIPFIGSSYGMHDASWRSNAEFENPYTHINNGSHGCVNMKKSAAKYLYYNASVGTKVIIQN